MYYIDQNIKKYHLPLTVFHKTHVLHQHILIYRATLFLELKSPTPFYLEKKLGL